MQGCKTSIKFFDINPFLIIRGLSCPCCVQTSLSLNCLKLTTPGFPYNCLLVSCDDTDLKKYILGQILAWKSGLKVPFLPRGRSWPLQTILLSYLVGCDSPLQIVIAVWRPFFQSWRAPNSHYYSICRGMSHPTGTAITICRGLSHPTGHIFFKGWGTLWIYSRLFLMNKKGLSLMRIRNTANFSVVFSLLRSKLSLYSSVYRSSVQNVHVDIFVPTHPSNYFFQ